MILSAWEVNGLFGYVKPYQPELKVCELELYKSVYCGLCKQIGRLYGQVYRSILSYDMTFLALVSLSLQEDCGKVERKVCLAHPLHKKPCMRDAQSLSFAANVAMILAYGKVKDHLLDAGFFGKLKYYLVLPWVKRARRKAAKACPDVDQAVQRMLQEQFLLEQEQTASVDRACDPSAKCLAAIAASLSQEEGQRRQLEKIGYMMGRYIYLMDALDDLEEDMTSGGYNPYLRHFDLAHPTKEQQNDMTSYAVEVLNLTVAQLAEAYEELELKRFQPILDNIIYLGMRNTRERILKKRESKDDTTVSSAGR